VGEGLLGYLSRLVFTYLITEVIWTLSLHLAFIFHVSVDPVL